MSATAKTKRFKTNDVGPEGTRRQTAGEKNTAPQPENLGKALALSDHICYNIDSPLRHQPMRPERALC